MEPNPIKIFIAYSRRDKTYLDTLRTYLTPLERNKSIQMWYDGEIVPGTNWEEEIKEHLHAADIILLLVSANSLASDYFYDEEMADALVRHEKGEAIVIPIILSHCPWDITDLKKLQALPKDGIPISDWTNPSKAYTNIVRGLDKSVKTIEEKKAEKAADLIAQQEAEAAERQRQQEAQAEQERLEALKQEAKKRKERQRIEAERRQKELAEQDRRRQLELQKEREKIAQQKAEANQKRLTTFKQHLLEADKATLHEDWQKVITAYEQSLQYYYEGDSQKKLPSSKKSKMPNKNSETKNSQLLPLIPKHALSPSLLQAYSLSSSYFSDSLKWVFLTAIQVTRPTRIR